MVAAGEGDEVGVEGGEADVTRIMMAGLEDGVMMVIGVMVAMAEGTMEAVMEAASMVVMVGATVTWEVMVMVMVEMVRLVAMTHLSQTLVSPLSFV